MPLLLATLALLACTDREPTAREPRFNLILISIDTLRADHVGAYGYPLPTTPHIDAMAEHSLRMTSWRPLQRLGQSKRSFACPRPSL